MPVRTELGIGEVHQRTQQYDVQDLTDTKEGIVTSGGIAPTDPTRLDSAVVSLSRLARVTISTDTQVNSTNLGDQIINQPIHGGRVALYAHSPATLYRGDGFAPQLRLHF